MGIWNRPAPPPPTYKPMVIPPSGGLLTTSAALSGLSMLPDSFLSQKMVAGGAMERWQLVMVVSFMSFFVATSIPGRLDTKIGLPKREDMRFFTPAAWAFSIWGVIFLGEMLMAITVGTTPGALSANGDTSWLKSVAPYYAASCFYQVVWCGCFREWAMTKLWLPAMCLTLAAVSLFGAHNVLAQALASPGTMSTWGYFACHLPMSLHFGWMCAAAVLSWNNVANAAKLSQAAQITFAIASCYLAAAFLGIMSVTRKDPLPSFVAFWALLAVSKGHEVLRDVVNAVALETLNTSAALCSALSLAICIATFVKLPSQL